MSQSSLPPRRRFRGVDPDERVAQRREQLLEAGLEAFGTRGFHAVGVRDVCAIAKLTERYFYESFKNREALLNAVYERSTQHIERAITDALKDGAPDSKTLTRLGLRAALSTFRGDPRIARVVLIEVLGAGAGEKTFEVSQGFANLIEHMALALYPNVSRHGVSPQIIANGLYGSTVYIAMRWTLGGFKESLTEIVEHCALFYDSLLTEMTVRESVLPPPPSTL
jgi:AcrR family transcriptional regulator